MTTAVAKRTTTELVVEGAGLDGDIWQPARVAALQKLLPPKFQDDPSNLIALASLVDRTGLDPFIRELYCWEDKGRVTYHVGRDGWLKIAKRDPDIESVISGVIYENDAFSFKRDEEGLVHIQHSGGFPQGQLMGAYAVVRLAEGPDQIVVRELTYFKHLLNKDNWRNYPGEMLETRVLATAIKFVSPLAAGLYAPGEAADDEYVPAGVQKTQERAQTLAGELRLGREVEVESEEPEEAEMPADDLVNIPETPEEHVCEFCGASFDTPQGRSSHLRTHREERDIVARLEKAGYLLEWSEEDGWIAVHEQTGEIVGASDAFEDVVDAADEHAEQGTDDPAPESPPDSYSAAQVYKAMAEYGPDCDQAWLRSTMALHFKHRLRDGAEAVSLMDLTGTERAELVAQMAAAFGS